jgi:hypothetical protein
MEQIISQRNTLPTAIGQIPPMSFAIANNLLAPNIKATNLKISPWATTTTTWNNSKNPEKMGPIM